MAEEEKSIFKIKIGGVDYNLIDVKASRADHKHSANDITKDILPVSHGGTGKATHTINAVLTGNDGSAVNNVETANGALYATEANDVAQFGTLPIPQGGTGATTAMEARTALEVSSMNGLYYSVEETATATRSYIPQMFIYIKNLEKLYRTNKAVDIGSDIPSQSDIVSLTREIKNNMVNISQVSPSISWMDYSVGEYVRVGDWLRRITSPISAGNVIDNSNSIVVTVADELYDVKAAAKKATNITDGILSENVIPTLPASKISGAISTSGGTISKGGLTISGGNLTTSNNKIILQSTNINRDGVNPSPPTEGNAILSFGDADSERICQLVPRRNTDGSITLSIASVNEKTDGTQVYCTIGLTVDKDGSSRYSMSNPAAFRSAIGVKDWELLGSLYGNVGNIVSYNLNNYSEVMFVAYYGSIYCGSAIIPTKILSSTTQREIYLGGGSNGNNVGRNFAIKATLTQGVIASASVDGSAITAQWEVYGK